MILIGAGAVVPLLGVAVIQAVAHQDPSGLLRTTLLRLPMALLLTGVVIELVSLGLSFTDQASVALLSAGGDPAARAFARIEAALAPASPNADGFGVLVLVVVVALVGFMLWVELAVRSAAVALATLFLPLALAGLVWPATAHWARRLGETLAGLVLMKLVMAAVLALAGGALAAGAGGVASVVEGVALLGLTAFAPFALFRLIPVVEAGAVAQLEGARPAQAVKDRGWSFAADSAQALRSAVGGVGSGSRSGSGQAPMPDLPSPASNVFAGSRAGGGAGQSDGGGRAGAGRGAAGGTTAASAGGGRAGSPDGRAGSTASRAPSSSGGPMAGAPPPRGEAGWLQRISDRTGGGGRGPA